MLSRLGLILLAAVAAGFAGLGAVLVPHAVIGAVFLGLLAGIIGFTLAVAHLGSSTVEPPPGVSPDAVTAAGRERRGIRVGLTAAVAVAASTLTVTGMAAVLGVATAPVLVAAALLAAPWAWARWRPQVDRYRIARRPTGSSCLVEPNLDTGPRPLVSVLDSLSTPALCVQWQRSFAVLTAATDPAAREQVVALRRRYLDELERRDPDGLARWLAADTRPAATNPFRHLTDVAGSPPGTRQGPNRAAIPTQE